MTIKTCVGCGEEFEPLSNDNHTRYCNPDCEMEAEVADREQAEYDALSDDY